MILSQIKPSINLDYNKVGIAIALTNTKFLRSTIENNSKIINDLPFI